MASCKKPTHSVFLLEDRHEVRQLPRVVVGDVLKRLPKECPKLPAEKERP